MRCTPLFLLFSFLLLRVSAIGGQVIIGQVFDETTGTAVRAAEVLLVDGTKLTRARSLADSAGWFRLVAPVPGRYRVQASSLGYANLETVQLNLEKGVELHLELRLSSMAVPHEPLRIVARRPYRLGRLAEYYDRAQWTRKTGLGRVLMRDDIDRMGIFSVSSLIRTTPSRFGCQMTYMLDGLPIEPDILDSMIRPDEVEGIEIYRGFTQIPPQYMNRTNCGLVLVWTRLDPPGARPFSWKRVFVGLGAAGVLFGLGRLIIP